MREHLIQIAAPNKKPLELLRIALILELAGIRGENTSGTKFLRSSEASAVIVDARDAEQAISIIRALGYQAGEDIETPSEKAERLETGIRAAYNRFNDFAKRKGLTYNLDFMGALNELQALLK